MFKPLLFLGLGLGIIYLSIYLFVCLSIYPSIYLYIFLSILGLGLGIIYLPRLDCITQYFDKKRPFVTGKGISTYTIKLILIVVIRAKGRRGGS